MGLLRAALGAPERDPTIGCCAFVRDDRHRPRAAVAAFHQQLVRRRSHAQRTGRNRRCSCLARSHPKESDTQSAATVRLINLAERTPCKPSRFRIRPFRVASQSAFSVHPDGDRGESEPAHRKQETASKTRSTDHGWSAPPPTRSKFRNPPSSRYVLIRIGALRCRGSRNANLWTKCEPRPPVPRQC
jgi:hypothetical protein